MMMNSPCGFESFYTNSPSSCGSSHELITNASASPSSVQFYSDKNEATSTTNQPFDTFFTTIDNRGYLSNSYPTSPELCASSYSSNNFGEPSISENSAYVQQQAPRQPVDRVQYQIQPHTQSQQQHHQNGSLTSAGTASRLPAIDNFMKEVQVKEEFSEYYVPNQSMSDYRVEKVANTLGDPYQQLEQPIYADFTNTQMLNQQDMLNMNFHNTLATNYMGAAQMAQPQTVQFNFLDLNLSNFSQTNPACDTSLPLMHQSQSQPQPQQQPQQQQPTAYIMSHTNFTPPPQDPLVPEQKPVKKRMAAVQCHQNSVCSNCKTRETTLWRRNGEGGVECNACNLYFRKNNRKRPLSLRKEGIMKRNRRPRNESPNGPIRRQGHAAAC